MRPGCAACWCHWLSFSSSSSRPEVLTDYEEGVGGSDSALSVREARPVVSQAETQDKTSFSACCCFLVRLKIPHKHFCRHRLGKRGQARGLYRLRRKYPPLLHLFGSVSGHGPSPEPRPGHIIIALTTPRLSLGSF